MTKGGRRLPFSLEPCFAIAADAKTMSTTGNLWNRYNFLVVSLIFLLAGILVMVFLYN